MNRACYLVYFLTCDIGIQSNQHAQKEEVNIPRPEANTIEIITSTCLRRITHCAAEVVSISSIQPS